MRPTIHRAYDTGRAPGSDEAELAAEFLEIRNERELDQFLPLLLPALKLAAPLVTKVAGPLLKGMAGSLLGGGGAARRRKRSEPESQQEQFLGKVIGGLLGRESEVESEEEEQFIGDVVSKLMGESELENEQEAQFIDKVLAGLFGASRGAQEQLLGGLLGKLFAGESEQEGETGPRPSVGLPHAQRFIQLAHAASRIASTQIAARLRRGRVPAERELREIVLRAFVRTAHDLARPAPAAQQSELQMDVAPATGIWHRHGNVFTLDDDASSGEFELPASEHFGVPRLLSAMARKRYVVYAEPFKLNIIGVRSTSALPNSFDDTMCVMFKEPSGSWILKKYKCTTEPGKTHLLNPMNVKGTAILVPGQYPNSHKLGLHKNSYTALVQQNSVAVYRDNDKNDKLDTSEDKIDRGLFGINIHRAGTNSTAVDGWSAGCQVFAQAAEFAEFIKLCQRHKALHGNNFTYSLLRERDL